VFVAEEVDHVTARCVTGTGDGLQIYSTSNLIAWTAELDRTCRLPRAPPRSLDDVVGSRINTV